MEDSLLNMCRALQCGLQVCGRGDGLCFSQVGSPSLSRGRAQCLGNNNLGAACTLPA